MLISPYQSVLADGLENLVILLNLSQLLEISTYAFLYIHTDCSVSAGPLGLVVYPASSIPLVSGIFTPHSLITRYFCVSAVFGASTGFVLLELTCFFSFSVPLNRWIKFFSYLKIRGIRNYPVVSTLNGCVPVSKLIPAPLEFADHEIQTCIVVG